MREVFLKRTAYTEDRTLGVLTVMDGPIQVFRSVTLELPWKDNASKVSCIPAGRYPLKLEFSNAFKTDLWELKLVPGRSEVKIHPANYPSELLGCIAPGMFHGDIDKDGKLDTVSSKKALAQFHMALDGMRDTWITVTGDGRDAL